MLLTDGHANRGVSDPEGIVNLLKGCLDATGSENIAVSTFGYGFDHQADLLKRISEGSATTGSYYFIESSDDVSSAFGDCLGGLLSVAAQNIRLTVQASAGALNVKHANAKQTNPSKWTVEAGDIFAEEVKDVVIEVSLMVTYCS